MKLDELIPVLTLLAAAIVRFIPSYTSLTGSLSKIKNVIPAYLNILDEIKFIKKLISVITKKLILKQIFQNYF